MAFVCLVEARLHFGEVQDLKGKRKLIKSLKDQLRQRFGSTPGTEGGVGSGAASPSEPSERSVLCALVGDGEIRDRADGMVRFIESRCPDGCSFERDLLSLEDVRG